MASAGMERVLDARLLDPAQRGTPIALSIDSRVQSIIEMRARQRGHLDAGRGRHRHRHGRPDRRGRRHGLGARPSTPMRPAAPTPSALLQSGDDGRLRARLGVQADHHRRGDGGRRRHLGPQTWDASAAPCRRASGSTTTIRIAPMLDIPQIITLSSNIAAARIADAMGARADAGGVPRARLRQARRRSSCASAAGRLWPARMGPADGDDLGLRPRPRDDAAPSRHRLLRAGQWRHLAPGDPARVAPGARCPGRRRLLRGDQLRASASCCGSTCCRAPGAAPMSPASASAARPAPPRRRPPAAITDTPT